MTTLFSRVILLFYFIILTIQLPYNCWAVEKIQTSHSSSSSSHHNEEIDDDNNVSRVARAPQLSLLTAPIEHLDVSQRTSMPYKLGFEFQEISGLCPWALQNSKYQKKPLFQLTSFKNQLLWHVELDTSDIEFVTPPFIYKEKQILEESVKTIYAALNSLKRLLDQSLKETTFKEWLGELERSLVVEGYYLTSLENFFHDQTLKCGSRPWKPHFSPQITIQHPLEWTIPLYFGLFGFESGTMLPFFASLPNRELLLKAIKSLDRKQMPVLFENYTQKSGGLLFLHAQTLIGMSPAGGEEEDDIEALNETVKHLDTNHQVDPKARLTLMSRRPFSRLLKDIQKYLRSPYQTIFDESIVRGNLAFSEFYMVPELFSKTNYGEQFFHTDGTIRALDHFEGFIEEGFVNSNRQSITDLLKRGVITTTMIRHFKTSNNLFDPYFQHALAIESQQHLRYNIEVGGNSIESVIVQKEDNDDPLSPPWVLLSNNSMGYFKLEEMIDKRYGEAIVEVRGIQGIGSWFLKKFGIFCDPVGQPFLSSPDSFGQQAVQLLESLGNFDTEIVKDVQLGIIANITKFKMN
jgi:hypothetical protein